MYDQLYISNPYITYYQNYILNGAWWFVYFEIANPTRLKKIERAFGFRIWIPVYIYCSYKFGLISYIVDCFDSIHAHDIGSNNNGVTFQATTIGYLKYLCAFTVVSNELERLNYNSYTAAACGVSFSNKYHQCWEDSSSV